MTTRTKLPEAWLYQLDPPPRNLAELLITVEAARLLTSRRRADQKNGLRIVSELLGRPVTVAEGAALHDCMKPVLSATAATVDQLKERHRAAAAEAEREELARALEEARRRYDLASTICLALIRNRYMRAIEAVHRMRAAVFAAFRAGIRADEAQRQAAQLRLGRIKSAIDPSEAARLSEAIKAEREELARAFEEARRWLGQATDRLEEYEGAARRLEAAAERLIERLAA